MSKIIDIRFIRNSVKYTATLRIQTSEVPEQDMNSGEIHLVLHDIKHLDDICVDGTELVRNTDAWQEARTIIMKRHHNGH